MMSALKSYGHPWEANVFQLVLPLLSIASVVLIVNAVALENLIEIGLH